jgi:SagB-type dehydrogenase family enzyme
MEKKTIDTYIETENDVPEYRYLKEMKNMVEIFHQNSKQTPVTASLVHRSIVNHLYSHDQLFLDSKNKKDYFLKPITQLPKREVFLGSFEEITSSRKSCREYEKTRLSDQELSNMLSSLRVTRRSVSTINRKAEMNLRTYASPGGLYPVEVYVLRPNNSDDGSWEAGYYSVKKNSLSIINERVPRETMQNAIVTFDEQIKDVGAIILLTGVFERTLHKYGAMGYKFALIESGGMLQQLALGASSLGLGGLAWAGIYDDKINKIIEVDGVDESFLTCFLVGKAE